MDFIGKWFKGDKVLWIIYLFLCLISIIEVYSASSRLVYNTANYWGPIMQHITILTMGSIIVWIVHRINYKWFQLIPVVLLPVSAILLLLVPILGVVANNASRALSIGGIQFQPLEFAKMALVLGIAVLLSKVQGEDGANPKAFKYLLWPTFIICGLIAPQNLSTAVLLFGVIIMMMFVGRVSYKQLGKLLGSLALLVGLLVSVLAFTPTSAMESMKEIPGLHRLPTWKDRIETFFVHEAPVAPEQYDLDENGQIGHANIAIASSNIIGKMPGNSVQRDFLSLAFSDFIFAIIIEELGLLGGAFVVFLYICILIRAGKIAKRAKGNFATFLVIGVALMMVTQAVMNMCVAVGLFPVTGQPLPLISKGGTSIITNCIYIGMVLSVSRYTMEQEQKAESNPEAMQSEPTSEVLQDENVVIEN